MPWDKAKKTEGEVLKEYAISYGIPSENILVTKDVENTADEAVAVKGLIGPNKKIILVTSAFHMYRANKLFEREGFSVVSYNVDYKAGRNKETVIMDFLPNTVSLILTETGIREMIGSINYIIKR